MRPSTRNTSEVLSFSEGKSHIPDNELSKYDLSRLSAMAVSLLPAKIVAFGICSLLSNYVFMYSCIIIYPRPADTLQDHTSGMCIDLIEIRFGNSSRYDFDLSSFA